MNKLSELDKAGKISLLEAIKNGEITPGELTPETIIVSDGKEAFYGLMVASSQVNNKEIPIVFIGEARNQLDEFFEKVKERNEALG